MNIYCLLNYHYFNPNHPIIYCFQLSNLINYHFLKNIYQELSYHEPLQDTLFTKEFKGF